MAYWGPAELVVTPYEGTYNTSFYSCVLADMSLIGYSAISLSGLPDGVRVAYGDYGNGSELRGSTIGVSSDDFEDGSDWYSWDLRAGFLTGAKYTKQIQGSINGSTVSGTFVYYDNKPCIAQHQFSSTIVANQIMPMQVRLEVVASDGFLPYGFLVLSDTSFIRTSPLSGFTFVPGSSIDFSIPYSTQKSGQKIIIPLVKKAATYKIQYNGNGGSSSVSVHTVTEPSSISLPSAFRTGYTLKGWYTAASGGSKVGDAGGSYSPTANITLYAQWNPIEYTIAFNGNGASSGSMNSISASYGSSYTLPQNTFAKRFTVTYNGNGGSTGQSETSAESVFSAWNTSQYGTGVGYSDGASVSNMTTVAGSTITLYAQWTGQTISLPSASRTGYTLKGWYTAASGGSKVGNAGGSYSPTADITLYAQWSFKSYTVSFDGQGGTSSALTKVVTYASTYGSLPSASRTGYTFLGWYTAVSGGSKITSSTTVAITSNITLYARWEANKYLVIFEPDGGSTSTGSISSIEVTYGSEYGELPAVTKEHYVFAGWYTASDGGDLITADSKVAVASDHKLYARWVTGTYTVVYDGNGASSGSMSDQVFTFGVESALKTCSYVYDAGNYLKDFLGWSQNKDATAATYTDGQTVMNLGSAPDDVVRLYAVWRDKVKITVASNDTSLGTVKLGSGNSTSGYFSVGASVDLVATVSDSSKVRFLGWYDAEGNRESQSQTYEINVGTEDTTYQGRFRFVVHKLTVSDPSVGGNVRLLVDGNEKDIEKDGQTSIDVLEGQNIVLYATAEYNYDAKGWTMTQSGVPTYTSGGELLFTVSETHSAEILVAPDFVEKPQYSISINKSGRGSEFGTISLSDSYGHYWEESLGSLQASLYVGLSYTAEATIKSGVSYVNFEGWFVDEALVEDGKILAIKQDVENDISITADFSSKIHTLNVSSNEPKFCHVEANMGSGSLDLTGEIVMDGDIVTVKAVPSVLRYLDRWVISGVDDVITEQAEFEITASMGDVVEAKAIVVERDNEHLTVDKQNGEYGEISVSYVDRLNTETGEVGDVEVVFNEDDTGKIDGTIYMGVDYTARAVLFERLSEAGNPLTRFVGWYKYENSEWHEITTDMECGVSVARMQARFAAYPLYSISLSVIEDVGGRVEIDKSYAVPDEDGEPAKWISGRAVRIIASADTGYEFKYFNIINDVTGETDSVDGNSVLNITNLDSSYRIEVKFGIIKCPVTFYVDKYSADVGAGSIQASVDGANNPDFGDMNYGDTVRFSATSNEGYQFDGWYVNGERYSDSQDISITLTSSIEVVAKFKALVTLGKLLPGSATGSVFATATFDESGTPTEWEEDDGTSVSLWVTLGDRCAIKATSSESVLGAWYDSADTELENPLDLANEDAFVVLDTTEYVARFINEDDYVYVALFNELIDPTEMDDAVVLGTLTMTPGEVVTEDEYNAGIVNNGYSGEVISGAFAYYRFLGSYKSLLQALPKAGRTFRRWERSVLTNGEFSSSEVYSEESEVTVNTNRNFIFSAYWGEIKPVDISISFLSGSRGLGVLRMDGETENRVETDISISDRIMQGQIVTISALAQNGYKFAGWYADALGTVLYSDSQTFSFEVRYKLSLFAKFEEDRNAIYRWEGSDVLKTLRWKSKVYVSTKPFDPVCARVDAVGYSVGMKVGMFSSPNDEASCIKSVEISSQDARRLPRSRPERYCQVEIEADNEVNSVFVSTNMKGMAI